MFPIKDKASIIVIESRHNRTVAAHYLSLVKQIGHHHPYNVYSTCVTLSTNCGPTKHNRPHVPLNHFGPRPYATGLKYQLALIKSTNMDMFSVKILRSIK